MNVSRATVGTAVATLAVTGTAVPVFDIRGSIVWDIIRWHLVICG